MGTFSSLMALCAGNSPVTGEFPSQRPVARSFDVFFNPRLNKRLSKQSWGWWFETPSCSLRCPCNDHTISLSLSLSDNPRLCLLVSQSKSQSNSPIYLPIREANNKRCCPCRVSISNVTRAHNDAKPFFYETENKKCFPHNSKRNIDL